MGAVSSAFGDGRHHFAAALQSALTTDEVEFSFLQAAHLAISGPSCGLYRIAPGSGTMLNRRARVEIDFLDEYEEFGRSDDPVLDFVLLERRPIDSSRVVDRTRWDRSGACSALQVGGCYHSLEAPLIVAGMLYGTINFARPRRDPPFSDADLISARVAAEQLGLAIERAMRYEATGQRATLLEHVLDRVPQAVVITDLDARVVFRNRLARAKAGAVGEPDGTWAIVEQSIAVAMEEFRRLGKRVCTRTGWDARHQRALVVKSFRLPDRDDAAMSLVFECAEEGAARLPTWDVLSRREQEIAALVSQGLTNKQIAERAFVSENTVKQHLKRVFAKTDVRNRAELMQRIWSAGKPDSSAGPAA
ncbi:MAG: LuxR C-terminal-related transcriptional regulator [Trebonia sp.]